MLACWLVLAVSATTCKRLTQLCLIRSYSHFTECNAEIQHYTTDDELCWMFRGDFENRCTVGGDSSTLLTSENIQGTGSDKGPFVTETLQEGSDYEAADKFADRCERVHLVSSCARRPATNNSSGGRRQFADTRSIAVSKLRAERRYGLHTSEGSSAINVSPALNDHRLHTRNHR
jgi:hypothetical protein